MKKPKIINKVCREYVIESHPENGPRGSRYYWSFADLDQHEPQKGTTYHFHNGYRNYKRFDDVIRNIKKNISRDRIVSAVIFVEPATNEGGTTFNPLQPNKQQIVQLRKEVEVAISEVAN